MLRYGIVGFDSDNGGTVPGSAGGPQALRERGLLDAIRAQRAEVQDYGDILALAESTEFPAEKVSADEAGIRDIEAVYRANAALYGKVSEILDNGRFPLIFGGDHSLSIGSVAAVADFYRARGARIGLIWIDTHPDFNTPKTSPSMRAFGMPVAVLSGRVPGVLASLQRFAPAVLEENVAFVGLRDVDPGEREYLAAKKLAAFSIKEVDRFGIAEVIDRSIRAASQGTDGFVVSFDLDVCDPALVPGTGTPHRGGLTFRESHLALEMLYDSRRMRAFELVELNPRLDIQHTTADFALSLIEDVVGKSIL